MSADDADYQIGPEAQFLQRLHGLGATLWTGGEGFGQSECSRPLDWQNLTCEENLARLERFHWDYQPFICVNTGIPVAVFDSDTKNGGDPEKVRALLAELGVRIYAEVDTPSGGKHFYIKGHPDCPRSTRRRRTSSCPASPASTSSRTGATSSHPARCAQVRRLRLHDRLRRTRPVALPGRTTTVGRAHWSTGWPSSWSAVLRRRRARHPVVPASGTGTRASRGTAGRPTSGSRRTSTRRLGARPTRSPRPLRVGATMPSSRPR